MYKRPSLSILPFDFAFAKRVETSKISTPIAHGFIESTDAVTKTAVNSGIPAITAILRAAPP